MRAAKEYTGREVAVTLPPKVGARRHFRRHMATSRPASHGEFAGLGGWAPRSKGCLDVDCRKETPARRRPRRRGTPLPTLLCSPRVLLTFRRANSSWFGCPPFGGRPSCRPPKGGHLSRDVLAHLPPHQPAAPHVCGDVDSEAVHQSQRTPEPVTGCLRRRSGRRNGCRWQKRSRPVRCRLTGQVRSRG